MHRPTLRQRRILRTAAVPVAMLASAAVVWQSSYAAFTATTSSDANSWATGTVSLSNTMTGAAAFSVSNLKPGDSGSRCITVTNGGTLGGGVRLTTATTGDAALVNALDLTIRRGTATDTSCAGWTQAAAVASGALGALPTDWTGAASGEWTAAAGGDTVYRFDYSLDPGVGNAAAGKTAGATFTWELRTS